MLEPYDSYIICTSPRSGSTLLCSLLTAVGIAGNPKSYFHDCSIDEWLHYFDLVPDASLSERDTLVKIFKAAITQGSNSNDIFGLRVQRFSFEFLRQKLAVLHPEHITDAERFKAVFGNTLYIHLTRQNKVEQSVSYVKATQSGLWHASPDGTELERLSPPQELKYDGGEILKQIEEMNAYDQGWTEWFAKEKINPLQIKYETLSENPIKILCMVLEKLGLDSASANEVEISVGKLADQTSEDWVNRFRSEYVH